MVRLGRGYPISRIVRSVGSNVLFDAVSNGNAGSVGGTSVSWSHTAAAGATVLVDIITNSNVTFSAGPTYNSVAMTLLGSQASNNTAANGTMYRYKISGVAGGAQTVAMTLSASTFVSAVAVSYLNVKSVGSTTTLFGAANTSMSQVGTISANGQRLVSGFATSANSGQPAITGVSGGTNRYNGNGVNSGDNTELSDAGANTTFAATASTFSLGWAGLLTTLS